MTVEVEIIDRIYHNIENFCEANGFDVNEYMSNAIIERYNLNKYGDLNEKLVKIPPKENKEETNEAVIVKEEDKKDITVLLETEKKEEKPKRTRRTLKAK